MSWTNQYSLAFYQCLTRVYRAGYTDVCIYLLLHLHGVLFSSLIKIMEQISTKPQVSVLQYWFLQEHCKSVFIYLSYYEMGKNVPHNHFSQSMLYWKSCLFASFNRPFEAHSCFIFIFYFMCICGRKDECRMVVLFLKTTLCLHFVLISTDLIEMLVLAQPGTPHWKAKRAKCD